MLHHGSDSVCSTSLLFVYVYIVCFIMPCVCGCMFVCFRVKMPFHHVRAGLLYTDNFLAHSLSEISDEQLAHISSEELDGECVSVCLPSCLSA